MTKTKRSPLKEERQWKELQTEKKAYLKRKQEEQEADNQIQERLDWAPSDDWNPETH